MSRTLSMNCGSGESLNASVWCGLSPNARQMRLIALWLIPVAAAIERVDQCVAFASCSSNVFTITRSTSSSLIERGLPGRGSSWRPSRPRVANRPRHRPTVEGLQPSSTAISVLDRPSAAANTTRQRNASACELFGRRAHRSSTSRSSSSSTTSARCAISPPIVVVDKDDIREQTPGPCRLTTQVTRIGAVKRRLLAWYETTGRDLPWRHTRDPYAILVCEVMLQQTQVDRVVPRYLRWLERWPTADSLASASAADVIVEWQGLGYNRRAVTLHRAVRHVAEHGWPGDLTALPGVGPYTAAAVGNFAFGRDVLPVDTNVRRVQERTGFAFDGPCAQALFDLGAAVCVARVPRCGVCPLAATCPSRGMRFEPARKQSPFEGSFRQRRALALRTVARGGAPEDVEAVASLRRDGLVALDADGAVVLPERA